MLVLVIGELHIPERAIDLPAKFRRLLVPGKIQKTICTGNLTDATTLEYLRAISPDIEMVRGEYDQAAVIEKVMHGEEKEGHMNTNKGKSAKDNKVLVNFVEGINIGVINQITPNSGADLEKLNNVATFMGVDILIYGTSSGKSQVFEDGGMLFINPGSATGALPECEVPSFVLMDISEPRDEMEQQKDRQVVVYLYKLVDNEVTIEKIEYNKPVY